MATTTQAPTSAAHRSQFDAARKWVDIARSLASLVESEVPQASKDSIITPKVVQAWKDAGLYGVLLPTHLGGGGVDNVTYIEIAEEISRQDASAGWVYANHQTGTLFPGMLLSEETFRELLGPNGDGIACGAGAPSGNFGTAKRVDGGYLVQTSPRPFGSGSKYANRVVARVALVDDNEEMTIGDDGNPIVVYIWVDPSNVEWLNDWNASGLEGTGSGSYRIKEHVLEAKWMGTDTGKRAIDDPAFTQGFTPVSSLHHAGVGLGLAKRIIEEIAKSARGRRRGDVPALDQYPLFQADFVRIESSYQAARALVLDAFREVWDAATAGRVTDLHTVRIEQANLHLHRALDEIVSTALLWAGSDVIPKDSIFARLNANARIALNHLMVGPQQAAKIAPQVLAVWQGDDSTIVS
ncbi:acyl-CoA dehydrogenase family protein [Nocardia sp. NPDC127606]|uniref:acyl-CoA dehydrogenase family protein n=1 Tax=Nocardia sp. NPDC127606 TaxID=3345406 RepID=UPI00363E6560